MIRHGLSEGWLLLRQRGPVSTVLAFALAVPISLAGVGLSLYSWLRPAAAMSDQASVVAVLLHPRLDRAQRQEWIAEQAAAHPQWVITEVSHQDLVARLERWFPYLEELVEGGDASLPQLVEITTTEPESVGVLEGRPEVLAVGPRSSVQQLLGRAARGLGWVLAVLSGILMAAAVLLASVWVHLELYRHADEITIMRLVGATEPTIRGPFLVAVAVPGIVAGALSVAGSLAIVGGLSRLAETLGLPAVSIDIGLLALEAAVGLLVPVTAAALTLTRHAGHEIAE